MPLDYHSLDKKTTILIWISTGNRVLEDFNFPETAMELMIAKSQSLRMATTKHMLHAIEART